MIFTQQKRKQWTLGWQWSVGWVIPATLLMVVYPLSWAQEANPPLGGWRITPRISVGTTYSDNIGLAPEGNAESDLVWEVDPGVSVRKRGGRLDLRLDYTAQGLFYSQNNDANRISHQLQAFGTAELYKSHLFLDAYGSISQVPIQTGGRIDAGHLGTKGGASSNLGLFNSIDFGLPGGAGLLGPLGASNSIALTDNQATGQRFGISPYWRQRWGGWAEGLLRYRYDSVSYHDSDTATVQPSGVPVNASDTQTHSVDVSLASGPEFSMLNWNLNYRYRNQTNQDNAGIGVQDDNQWESLSGQMSYRLNRAWALLAQAGYENNQVNGFDSDNGAYWGLGAIWTPNRFFRVQGSYGPDLNEITLRWIPSLRTHLEISRRDQDVGVAPGVRWQGTLNHRTRYTTWSVTYSDDVTNEQQLLGSDLLLVGPNGQPLLLDDEQAQVLNTGGALGLSNQNFRRKRLDAGVTYRRGRTSVLLNAFNEDREGQNAVLDENIRGASALWVWRFAPRTASFIGTGWEHDDNGEGQENDYWVSVLGLARVFTPNAGGLISYRYYRNDAEPSEQGFRENRLNVRFNMRF